MLNKFTMAGSLTVTSLTNTDGSTFTDVNGTVDDLTISAAGIFSISDIRTKENIIEIDNALDKVLQVNPVEYNFIKDPTEQLRYGVIAQQLEEIFPTMVRTNATGYKSVNYTELIPVLIQAIKERSLVPMSRLLSRPAST